MKRTYVLLCGILLLASSHGYAQTWGCGEKDYKCQLDVRMKALQADPKNPENYYNLGIVFQRSGNHKEAIESYSMYVAIPGLKPEMLADGYNNRGIAHKALKKLDLAYADYTKAIQLNPKNPNFFVSRGNVNSDLKKFDDALADYASATALNPKYAPAYAQRGILHASQSRIEDAMSDYARSIEADPAYAEPYYNRGIIYFRRKEFAKAIPDFDKYIVLVGDNPAYLADGYINRGIAHYYTGSPQKAIEDITKSIEFQPQRVNSYRARAAMYKEMKKNDLAEADERKAAQLSAPPK